MERDAGLHQAVAVFFIEFSAFEHGIDAQCQNQKDGKHGGEQEDDEGCVHGDLILVFAKTYEIVYIQIGFGEGEFVFERVKDKAADGFGF